MQDEKQQPYFFNPGMTSEQLEDWLGQQKLHLTHYNRLVKEKAALVERLGEINASISLLSTSGFVGMLSFPYSSNPLLENPQIEKPQKVD
ncbi:hypothetical protein IF822_25460 [Citrobacter freundii]|uniref:hypothetical protein n=1 Tax=Citrobacter freundii TaxID=546 RepID=UPI000949A3C7|nr:hypothetical protein [Citrobacter freundii]EKN0851206.1 hypothetical protein [Salmonella enterica]MBD5683096.1 hypothetical protein [Citrobacter freundii]MCU0187259.1 hypothetical protein [Citrobacter freundii]HBK3068171.1 hypothetical protein [Citrobacter freundii]